MINRLATAALERAVALRDPATSASATKSANTSFTRARASFATELNSDQPFSAIAARARLVPSEAEVLALALAIDADERLAKLVVHLTGDRERHRLEVGLLAELLDAPTSIVGPGSRLVGAALVRVDAARGLARAVVDVAPRVAWALAGDRSPDPDLPIDAELHTDAGGDDAFTALLVTGRDRIRRRQSAIARSGGACVVVSAPVTDEAWAALVREATLANAMAAVESDAPISAIGRRWIERADHLRWAVLSKSPLEIDSLPDLAWREVEAVDAPPSDEEWATAMGPTTPRSHRLTAQQLDAATTALAARDGDVDAAVRRLVSPKLDSLARRIRPKHQWDDLVLPPDHAGRLRDLVNRYQLADHVYDDWGFPPVPSRGLVALFSGPSGTGKTLAAEIVAGELGLDLYKLDLSSVVSKWVGETEKNLDELFEAAGAGNLVLFFDEADALFSKRSDVSDAHDRYANLETSYLLQRLETYDGVVIMATNYEKNIDQAFMRRIHVRVDFALPDERERLAIWQRHIRADAPVADDVDLGWLAARFELPGAAIRNAIVDGAFLTAAADRPSIDMCSLVRGVARELRKLGRLVRREDFAEWYPAVVAD